MLITVGRAPDPPRARRGRRALLQGALAHIHGVGPPLDTCITPMAVLATRVVPTRAPSTEDKSSFDACDGGFPTRRVGRVRSIVTYPLKGVRGQTLERAVVSLGSSTPRDREFALLRHENIEQYWADDGDVVNAGEILEAGDGKHPGHHSNKHLFHQLITDPSMVRYAVQMLGESGIAVVDAATGETLVAADDVSDAAQRLLLEAFFGEALETSSAEKPPRLVRALGHSFANVGGKPKEHVLHLNTVPTVERCFGELVDKGGESSETFAMRFRPNLVIEDAGDGTLKPWSELGWCGHDVRVGPEVVLRVNEPTIRCPSTRVRYDTAGDDVKVDGKQQKMPDIALKGAFPNLKARIFGEETLLAEKGSYLGLYATVIQGGTMSPGDDVVIIG